MPTIFPCFRAKIGEGSSRRREMAHDSILGGSELIAFAPTTDPTKALAFYQDVLGLRLIADEKPFALVFDANGTMLRVTTVQEHHPEPFTVLGWRVENIQEGVERLHV